jgi:transcriptional regulator with XRE-family HTH domain
MPGKVHTLTDPDIASWIKRQLARHEWAAVDLSRRTGISTGAISEWMTGKRVPSPQSCLRLADAFGVDADTVLAIAGHRLAPVPPEDPKANLIAMISRADLSPEILAAITNMVRDFRRDRDPEDQSS